MQETPNPEANVSAECSRRVGVRLDDVHPTHVYNSDVIIDHAHTGDLRTRRQREQTVVSIERLERFASKASKRGKIVTIGSPKAFLMLQSFLVGLTVTTSLGGSIVVRVSYVR